MKFSVSPERIVPKGEDAGINGIARLADGLGMKVVHLGRTTVIVDGDEQQVGRLIGQLPGWLIEPVQTTVDDNALDATLRYLRSQRPGR